MTPAALLVAAYFAGSIPFGVLLTRWLKGVDVRASGSGNIGATNVARVAGKRVGALVLLLDAAKGALPVLAALRLLPEAPLVHAAVGAVAFLGHVFPVWLRFKGGKGVATALGVFGVLLPWSALIGFGVYALLFALLRVSSVGSLAGAAAAVLTGFFSGRPREYALLSVVLLAAMLFTHRSNIARLMRRTEGRL